MHTPGPWSIKETKDGMTIRGDRRRLEIVSLIHEGGEQVIVGKHTGLDCLTDANARLIAAAPELLEAARAALPYLVRLGDFIGNGEGDTPMGRCEVILAVKNALAHAEGRETP